MINSFFSIDCARIGRSGLLEIITAMLSRLAALQGNHPYAIDYLAVGWYCRKEGCGVFNGDEKVFLLNCRACETERPKKEALFMTI